MSDVLKKQVNDLAEQAGQAAAEATRLANEAKNIAEQVTANPDNLNVVAQTTGNVANAATGGAIDPFVFQFAIFVMAIFVGYYVVWSVTPALHTPLMAVTNAISSVIVVGAILAVGIQAAGTTATTLGFIALVLAAVNIFGGFLVTQRMLAMYKKKER